MTTEPFDRRLSTWLERDAPGRVPDHLAEVLVATRATRQRPAWSSLERWLPVDLTLKPIPFLPGRPARLALVIALLLVAAAAFYLVAGALRPRVPAPFGPARNGLVVYESGGDVMTLDPATGRTTTIVGGIESDIAPRVSRDGTKILFVRALPGAKYQLMVAGLDGSGTRPLGGPIDRLDPADYASWSPDGTRVAVDTDMDGHVAVRIFALDGTVTAAFPHDDGSLTPAVGWVQWRPDGQGLVLQAWYPPVFGIWTVRVDGSGKRQILPGSGIDRELSSPALSPDGTTIAFAFLDDGQMRLVDSNTGADQGVTFPGGAGDDHKPAWSPDGSRLAFERAVDGTAHIVVAPATGGIAVTTGPSFDPDQVPTFAFSPDGSRIIAWFPRDSSTWLLDPAGGAGQRMSFDAEQLAVWQRLAP